jgi:hypothetical protein
MQSTIEQRPVPTISTGRELAVGSVISTTFSVWSKNLLQFWILSVAAMAPMIVGAVISGSTLPGITTPASVNPFRPEPTHMGAVGPFVAGALVTCVLFLVEVGAISHGVIQHLAGKPVSLGGMVGAGVRRFVPLVLAAIVSYLMIVTGSFLLFVPGIMLACALAVALPAIVAEGIGAGASISRSFQLTKSNRLRILAIFLVLFVGSLVVNSVTNFVLPRLTPFAPMLGAAVGMVINSAVGTLVWIAPSVVYHDLRRAKEGTSAVELAAVFD